MKVEKDWVHMDKVEYEKLEWMKDLPKPQAGDTQVSFNLKLLISITRVVGLDSNKLN